MGIPLFDVLAAAPAAILGLLGVWLGFRRWLVSWPMRWLVPIFAASATAALAILHLIVHRELADLVYLSGAAGRSAVAAVAFLATFVGLLMFMGNLRARIVVWTGDRRIGSAERVFGGLLGIACGLLLVAIPCVLYQATRPDGDGDPAWARESLLLPYFRSAGEAAKGAMPQPPAPVGQSLPQR